MECRYNICLIITTEDEGTGSTTTTTNTLSVGDVTSAQIGIVNSESFEETVMKNLAAATNSEESISGSSISVEGLGYKILWLNQEDGNIVVQDSETKGDSFNLQFFK